MAEQLTNFNSIARSIIERNTNDPKQLELELTPVVANALFGGDVDKGQSVAWWIVTDLKRRGVVFGSVPNISNLVAQASPQNTVFVDRIRQTVDSLLGVESEAVAATRPYATDLRIQKQAYAALYYGCFRFYNKMLDNITDLCENDLYDWCSVRSASQAKRLHFYQPRPDVTTKFHFVTAQRALLMYMVQNTDIEAPATSAQVYDRLKSWIESVRYVADDTLGAAITSRGIENTQLWQQVPTFAAFLKTAYLESGAGNANELQKAAAKNDAMQDLRTYFSTRNKLVGMVVRESATQLQKTWMPEWNLFPLKKFEIVSTVAQKFSTEFATAGFFAAARQASQKIVSSILSWKFGNLQNVYYPTETATTDALFTFAVQRFVLYLKDIVQKTAILSQDKAASAYLAEMGLFDSRGSEPTAPRLFSKAFIEGVISSDQTPSYSARTVADFNYVIQLGAWYSSPLALYRSRFTPQQQQRAMEYIRREVQNLVVS